MTFNNQYYHNVVLGNNANQLSGLGGLNDAELNKGVLTFLNNNLMYLINYNNLSNSLNNLNGSLTQNNAYHQMSNNVNNGSIVNNNINNNGMISSHYQNIYFNNNAASNLNENQQNESQSKKE